MDGMARWCSWRVGIMSVKAMFSYPEAMRKSILAKGMRWFACGGEFDSFADAMEEANRLAQEMNFPIQMKSMGQSYTAYPKSIGY